MVARYGAEDPGAEEWRYGATDPEKGGFNKLGGTMHEKILCREAVRLVIVVIALLSLFFFFFLREMYLVVVSS